MANRHNPPALPADWQKELRAARRKRKLGGYRYLQEPYRKPVPVPEDQRQMVTVKRHTCKDCGRSVSRKSTRCRTCEQQNRTKKLEKQESQRVPGQCMACKGECRKNARWCLDCGAKLNRIRRADDMRESNRKKRQQERAA